MHILHVLGYAGDSWNRDNNMLNIVTPIELAEELGVLYANGMQRGASTGWPTLDEFYTVAPGFWTIVTGKPSDGKSTWLDNLMLHLMSQGWRFIIYSPENQPHALYLAHLIERYLRRPFRPGYHNRVDPAAMAQAVDFLDPKLRILKFDGGANFPSLNTVMFTAHEIIDMEWCDGPIGVIVDPWNELDHAPVAGLTETQMVNHELMVWRQWIRDHGAQVHGWIVAHPQKPQRDRNGPRPITLYDINGSAAYYNKCDTGIVVRRLDDDSVQIDVEKCRFRHLGKKGSTLLTFNSGTGTYDDPQFRGGGYRSFHQEGDPF